MRAVLNLAQDHLHDQQREQHAGQGGNTGNLTPVSPEPRGDDEEADSEHGDHAHVHVDRVDDADAEPADVLSARVRSGGAHDRTGDDECQADRDAGECESPPPARPEWPRPAGFR